MSYEQVQEICRKEYYSKLKISIYQIKLLRQNFTKKFSHLLATVYGSGVFDSSSTGHHHPSSDGVDGVGHESSSYGNTITQSEAEKETGIRSQKHWFQGVVETEVETSVDEDTSAGDDETEDYVF